jgi:hypothetical protein
MSITVGMSEGSLSELIGLRRLQTFRQVGAYRCQGRQAPEEDEKACLGASCGTIPHLNALKSLSFIRGSGLVVLCTVPVVRNGGGLWNAGRHSKAATAQLADMSAGASRLMLFLALLALTPLMPPTASSLRQSFIDRSLDKGLSGPTMPLYAYTPTPQPQEN